MEAVTIMARETAPGFATQEMYVNDTTEASVIGKFFVSLSNFCGQQIRCTRLTLGNIRVHIQPIRGRAGGKAIAVPGEVRGYYEAWRRFGRVPWRELFTRSIQLARHGQTLRKATANSIDSIDLSEFPSLRYGCPETIEGRNQNWVMGPQRLGVLCVEPFLLECETLQVPKIGGAGLLFARTAQICRREQRATECFPFLCAGIC